MKIQRNLLAAITMLLIMVGGFSALDVKAEGLSKEESAVLSDTEVPAPMFSAYIEYSPQGYVVMGTFTEFSSDISLIRPLYSLNGESWHISNVEWDLNWCDKGMGESVRCQTQVCLYSNYEPLRSYLAGKLDRIYLKLYIAREDGSTFETQTAILERGDPQPLPEDINAVARFDKSILVSQKRPYSNHGRYQLTVSTDATAEDIAALLPDTLPVEIQLQRDNNLVAGGIVDCPVTWKTLILPQLIAGDSVTVFDAAEEIVIPGGTLVNTPIGIFQLNESLRINQFSATDEIRLVLNVVAEDEKPTGVLTYENDGLEMAFDLKPTGATAIHAYTFSDVDSGWMELSGLSLLEAVNSRPSAANSGYALVVGNDSELLQNYQRAKAAGEEPTPFYVGLKIEGGVYDGSQLVLVWPDTYHEIPRLPDMCGLGGNEGNAGTNNKGNSTEGGQRPNLPNDSAEVPGGQPGQSQEPTEVPEGRSGQSQEPADPSGGLSEQSQDPVETDTTEETKDEHLSLEQSPDSGDESGGQRPDLQQNSGDRPVERPKESQVRTDTGMEEIGQAVFLVSDAKTDIQMPEKTDSNTQISSHSLSGKIPLTTVIVISFICIIIIIGRRAAGRKF